MAEKSRKDESLNQIRQRVDQSREELARDLRGLRQELDIPSKIRRSFRSQTVVWITAAAAVGLVLTLLPARKKKIYVKAKGRRNGKETLFETGLLFGGLKIAASLLKPIILGYAVQKAKQFASRSKGNW